MPDRPLKILVLAKFDGTNANAIRDFLFSFNVHSKNDYYYIFDCRNLDTKAGFSRFDVILIFWSLCLLLPDLSEGVREAVREAPALKVLFLQDEYRDVRRTNRLMSQLGIQVIFTCVSETDHETFFPRSLIPSLQATYTVLPGYVPAYLKPLGLDRASPRPLDIGYRSRIMPYYLGDLGHGKRIIAERFQAISAEQGFRSDISVLERDRIYGKGWLDFLRRSRCVLGSPSGASVVDFSGEIRRNCELFLGVHPGATYDEVKRHFFADVDWKVVIDTVPPRVFEAAALRCTLVQHEGRYAGVLEPNHHYICVRRDYSNIGEVIDRIKDAGFCRQIAEKAHSDLIRSGLYSYNAFVQRFDRLLADHIEPVRLGSISTLAFYTRSYVRYNQAIIPYRDRFLVIPSRKLIYELVRVALSPLKPGRRGPVISRLVENPGDFFVRVWVALRISFTVPAIRKTVLCYLRHREVRGRVRFDELMNDLVKLDIVRQARAGILKAHELFRVRVSVDPEAGILTFTSRTPHEAGDDDVPPALPAALHGGRVKMIVWDHSGLGLQVVYATMRSRWLTVGLGSGGVYRFEALGELIRRFPEEMFPVLLSILRGDTPSLSHSAPLRQQERIGADRRRRR